MAGASGIARRAWRRPVRAALCKPRADTDVTEPHFIPGQPKWALVAYGLLLVFAALLAVLPGQGDGATENGISRFSPSGKCAIRHHGGPEDRHGPGLAKNRWARCSRPSSRVLAMPRSPPMNADQDHDRKRCVYLFITVAQRGGPGIRLSRTKQP
jgi:hypothetical protein